MVAWYMRDINTMCHKLTRFWVYPYNVTVELLQYTMGRVIECSRNSVLDVFNVLIINECTYTHTHTYILYSIIDTKLCE